MALTDRQESFVQWLIKGKSQREAYKLAGYKTDAMTDNAVDVEACKLLKRPKVSLRYEELRSRLVKEAEDEAIVSAKEVLKRWKDIAFADPNEIIQFRRLCCRHCFGKDHEYQWIDEEEYKQAVEVACTLAKIKDEEPDIPSDAGGYGYYELEKPHPKCPKCSGEGRGDIKIEDTRDLSPQAKALYAGVKTTQHGVEIKLHDQLKALDSLSRHLGLFNDKMEHSGPDGSPLQVVFSSKMRKGDGV